MPLEKVISINIQCVDVDIYVLCALCLCNNVEGVDLCENNSVFSLFRGLSM